MNTLTRDTDLHEQAALRTAVNIVLLFSVAIFVAAYIRWFDSTAPRWSQVAFLLVAVVNVIPFVYGARLLCITILSWYLTSRLFRGRLLECVIPTVRSYRRSLSGHSARGMRRLSLFLTICLIGSGIYWGFQYPFGFAVLAIVAFLHLVGSFCQPPVLLLLGPSDDKAISLARELKASLPFFRIAALLGGDIKVAKQVAKALGFDDFRTMPPDTDNKWLQTTYELHQVVLIFVVDGRRRVLAPDSLAEMDWISPALHVEIKNLLRVGRKNRADSTIVVVDSDGQSPSLDRALYRGGNFAELGSKLFLEPAHKETAQQVLSVVWTMLRHKSRPVP